MIPKPIFFSSRGENTADVIFPIFLLFLIISQNLVLGPLNGSPIISKPTCILLIPSF